MSSWIRDDVYYDGTIIDRLRPRLRVFLLMLSLLSIMWAEFTTCLIWYWAGRASGLAAHRYFTRWFEAWFLTQVLPLPVSSLSYHGGQYTVASMFRFLNDRYYLGASFGAWFWHCALAGAVISVAVFAAILCSLAAWDRSNLSAHLRRAILSPLKTSARRQLARIGMVRPPESLRFLIPGPPRKPSLPAGPHRKRI